MMTPPRHGRCVLIHWSLSFFFFHLSLRGHCNGSHLGPLPSQLQKCLQNLRPVFRSAGTTYDGPLCPCGRVLVFVLSFRFHQADVLHLVPEGGGSSALSSIFLSFRLTLALSTSLIRRRPGRTLQVRLHFNGYTLLFCTSSHTHAYTHAHTTDY